MLNKNESSNSSKSIINIKVILIVLVLVIFGIIQFHQNRKINLLYKYISESSLQKSRNIPPLPPEEMDDMSRKEFIGHMRHEFLKNLNREMQEMDALKDRIENEMKEHFDDNMDFDDNFSKEMNMPMHENMDFELKTEEKYNKDQKNYTLTVYLPKDMKENCIDVSIDKNLLYLKVSKNKSMKDGKEIVESNFASLKIISLPKTKATIKDIKKTFKDGKLTIVVPIK